ncbi:MAG: hypothetical protein MZW92_48530 [Comamonadaceae bacterium]|nr:hypothetical protein [Comamonadaceae bacterium]
MGQSSLLGIERAAAEPAGRDTASLGPSDSSDTGSDVAGIDDLDDLDPGQPLDAALDEDLERPMMPGETLHAAGGSDASGTGERRSAGNDPGRSDGADISVDRIIDPLGEGADHDDEDPDLGFVDVAEAGDPLEDEATAEEDPDDLRRARRDAVEDEAADPVGDGRSDAIVAAAQPPVPGRSGPVDPDDLGEDEADEADVPGDDADEDGSEAGESRRPGRA